MPALQAAFSYPEASALPSWLPVSAAGGPPSLSSECLASDFSLWSLTHLPAVVHCVVVVTQQSAMAPQILMSVLILFKGNAFERRIYFKTGEKGPYLPSI